MRLMTTNQDTYGRLIRCIVLNSFTSIFESNEEIPETITHICLSAMSSKGTDIRDRIVEFNYLVNVYKAKILKDCQRFNEEGENGMLALQTPREDTQARAFEFFDENRSELLKINSTGKLPTMITTSVIQEAARNHLGIYIDYKSNNKCERYMYWAYRNIAMKWWQSRVKNKESTGTKTSCDAEKSEDSSTHRNGNSVGDQQTRRKRSCTNGETDENANSCAKNEPLRDVPQNNGRQSPVYWVRSDKHFRSLMRLEQKKKKQRLLQSI